MHWIMDSLAGVTFLGKIDSPSPGGRSASSTSARGWTLWTSPTLLLQMLLAYHMQVLCMQPAVTVSLAPVTAGKKNRCIAVTCNNSLGRKVCEIEVPFRAEHTSASYTLLSGQLSLR